MIVNLSVHKNTMAQRKAKMIRRRMKADTRAMLERNIDGYAIVSWNRQGMCNVSWSLGNTDPTSMPDKVRNAILRVQAQRDIRD